MRKILFAAFLLAAMPAFADDMADHKKELLQNSKQETIALGGNKFLIFSGSQGAYQYAYSLDMVKIEGGVPHFSPLFIEEYDQGAGSVALSDGVGFGAESYHFDTKTGILSYTSRDVAGGDRLEFKYQLKGDTLLLQEVMEQEEGGEPTTLFKAADAKKN